MSLKKALLAFLAILVSYGIFLAWSLQEYQLYLKADIEALEEKYPADIVRWIDHESYFRRPYGFAAALFGLGILAGGFGLALHAASADKKDVENEQSSLDIPFEDTHLY